MEVPGGLASRYITIRAILDRTGIHRQTVHYYLRRGLLPNPMRTSRTSALYPNHTIELIQLIQSLQQQQRLSLEEIADLFRRHGFDPRAIRQAAAEGGIQPLHHLLAGSMPAQIAVSELRERIDPPPPSDWLDRVLTAGIVRSETREGRRHLSAEGLESLRALWDAVRSGAPVEQFGGLAQSIERQAQAEFKQFLDGLRQLPAARDAAPQVARMFSSLERFGAHRRRDALHALLLERIREPRPMFLNPNRTYVFPSRTLLQKMGLFRELDLLLRQVDRKPEDLNAWQDIARASYLSSDWTRLHASAQEILKRRPQDGEAITLYGQALLHLGRIDEALAVLEEAAARGGNPLARIRLGQAIAMKAYGSDDAARLLDAVVRRSRLSAEAIRESAGKPSLSRKIRLNALLDTLYFSDPLGLNRPVEQEAQALYDEFRSLSERKLGTLGRISLAMAKIYTAYGLYLVRQQQGNSKAAALLAEIAQLDPDCVLAARKRPSTAGKKRNARSPKR